MVRRSKAPAFGGGEILLSARGEVEKVMPPFAFGSFGTAVEALAPPMGLLFARGALADRGPLLALLALSGSLALLALSGSLGEGWALITEAPRVLRWLEGRE
mmetsp:Transcript_49479/g.82234  ORF Transcript_49479/g.82234 Transcript_49479/m.82234 type:complete len:102 (-) Transcript_49479:236-541(-)